MNQKGVTLLEIVIYVALFTVVSVLIGSQMNSMSRQFTGGTQKSQLQSASRDALAVMVRKIRNTGFKSYVINGALVTSNAACYQDQSSFMASEGAPGDELTTIQVTIDRSARFLSVDTTRYYLDGSKLCIQDNNCVTVISKDVYGLQFEYGILGADSTLINENPLVQTNWALTGCTWGTPNDVITTNQNTAVSIEYQKTFNITTPSKLSVRFQVEPYGGQAPADTLQWKIKSNSGSTLQGAARFKPFSTMNEVLIPVNSFTSGKLSLSFTKVVSGSIKISNVNLRIIEKGAYTWVDNPTSSQKKFVRAIRVSILTRSTKKGDVSDSAPDSLGNIPIPQQSGPYLWRLYKEVVEIQNNGQF